MRLFLATLAAVTALSLPAVAARRPAPAPPAPSAEALRAGAEAARDKALNDPTAYDYIESLTTDVGPRVAGSEAAERARDWGVARLKTLGFQSVHVEPFPFTAWTRGEESADVVSPRPQHLAIIGLGGSVPTPPEGIEAEAVVFAKYSDMLAAPAGSLTGKIAIVTQPMIRAQDGRGYGINNPIRRLGASEAARRGAVAYLHRSLATGESRAPHTGALNYLPDVPRIPAAALSVIDAELLDHMAARGQPIRIRLKLASSTHPATGWTVVGDIVGAVHPDQMIVIGGHLDSWDPGTGAIDDGAGMAITVAGARMAASAGPPRRTIRVVLFGAEEPEHSQLASEALAAAHAGEIGKIVAASESDEGADRVLSVRLPAGALAKPAFASLADILAPLSITVSPDPAMGSGSDVEGLNKLGAPAFSLRQDASRYFDWHHSAEDTLDKVDRAQLNQNVAAWAAVLYLLANSDEDLHPAPASVAPPAPKP